LLCFNNKTNHLIKQRFLGNFSQSGMLKAIVIQKNGQKQKEISCPGLAAVGRDGIFRLR
jgi:hypothetical protein